MVRIVVARITQTNTIFIRTLYFISLIPKVDSLLHLGEFRPISLIWPLYKMVAKVLVAKLTYVVWIRLFPLINCRFLKVRLCEGNF